MKHYIGDNVKNLQQHDSPDDQSPAPDLIVALRQPVQGPPRQMDGGPIMAAGAAALVGQMPSCHLGKDKIKRFKKWKDWLGDAKNKMAFLGISTDQQKVNFLRSCGGSDFTEFGEKEAHIRFTAVPADPDRGIAALDAHKYNEIIDESKKSMPTLISRDRAITDLLRIEQGNRSFMDFLAVVEDQEYLCRTDEDRITGDDLKRISLIAGMKDRTLAGRDGPEHNNNLRATLARAKEKGITFKLSRTTFCVPEVKWFGRVFSGSGVSADPDKIHTIVKAGRPNSIEEVKYLLQAAAYNAKFAFDHQESETYEEVAAPLCELLSKNATFSGNDKHESSYQIS